MADSPVFYGRTGLKNETQLGALQNALGYYFKDPVLLLRCMTHVSYERKKSEGHNEVLEFLGDFLGEEREGAPARSFRRSGPPCSR